MSMSAWACACGCVCMCRWRTAESAVSLQILEQDPPNSLKETDLHHSSVTHLWPTQLAFVDGSMAVADTGGGIGDQYPAPLGPEQKKVQWI